MPRRESVDDFVAKTEFIKEGKTVYDVFDALFGSSIEDALTQIQREKLLGDLAFEQSVKQYDYGDQQQKIQIMNAMADVMKKQAEINLMDARTEADKGKANLINKAVNNFDTLPQSLQVYVIRSVFNPNDSQQDDILLQEEIRDFLKMEKEAVAKKSQAEADRTKEETEFIKWKHEQTKKDKGTV